MRQVAESRAIRRATMAPLGFFCSALALLLLIASPAQAQQRGVTLSPSPADMELYNSGVNPGELDLEEGEAIFYNLWPGSGKRCSDCHAGPSPKGGSLKGAATRYPLWKKKRGRVVTLDQQINTCVKGGLSATPLSLDSPRMATLSLYVRWLSQGMTLKVATGGDAKATFNLGRKVYEKRRGGWNYACATCHERLAGHTLRMQKLAPLGPAAAHWPAYRMTKGRLMTLPARIAGCMADTRQTPFELDDYRMTALELYLTSLANGAKINVPGWVR